MTCPPSNPRHDLYRGIHKALRAVMADTLLAAGRFDADDDAEVADVVARARILAGYCRHHLDNENAYIHPAMESRSPGSSSGTAMDHAHHLESIDALEQAIVALAMAGKDSRDDAAYELYLVLSTFVGENLAHMDVEERHNNAVLWRTHSDRELQDIEQAIVSGLTPDLLLAFMRWMIPAVTPSERAGMLGGMQAAMPQEAFAGILDVVLPYLNGEERAKLTDALRLCATAA